MVSESVYRMNTFDYVLGDHTYTCFVLLHKRMWTNLACNRPQKVLKCTLFALYATCIRSIRLYANV